MGLLRLFTAAHWNVHREVTTQVFMYPSLDCSCLGNLGEYKPARLSLRETSLLLLDNVLLVCWQSSMCFSTDGFRGKVAVSRPTICYYSCKLTGAAESVSGRCQRPDYRPMCMHRKEVFIDEIYEQIRESFVKKTKTFQVHLALKTDSLKC